MSLASYAISFLFAAFVARQAVSFLEPRRSGWAMTTAFIAALIGPLAVALLVRSAFDTSSDANNSYAFLGGLMMNGFVSMSASAIITVLVWCGVESVIA